MIVVPVCTVVFDWYVDQIGSVAPAHGKEGESNKSRVCGFDVYLAAEQRRGQGYREFLGTEEGFF